MNEFALIQQYFKHAALATSNDSASSVVLGIGDDAALIQPPSGQQLVITSDTLVAGRHFPQDTPAHAIGWKAAAVNLSDIAAMGARPFAVLMAISLPEVDPDWLAQFSRGFFDCCAPLQVQLIGGDTTKSAVLSITVTALGWVEQDRAIRRDGARPGDLVVVSNTLGDAVYALHHPGSELQERLDYPQPRNLLGMALQGYASSMLDVSDGLAQDLGHILAASQVGAQLHLENLPLSSTLQQLPRQQAWQLALTGGDDYELCFTLSPEHFDAFCQQFAGQFQVQVIGQIIQGSGLTLQYQQQPYEMNLQGYQHFD
ncbi:thiamine-phosphate kinase [Alkanindiges illinoisensis]|uniref:thiamine-phosphate kinase n=1 Tax=Alkanindiges illinoisensis TaxID=197183 RepID=UPI00047E61D5|nr:thiamine-phosphate kinase [Alkanindiges illinoisensis]